MNMYPLRYCLTCGRIVATLEGEMHTNVIQTTPWDAQLVECFGPFATCPPPDNFDDNFDLNVMEPDADELFIMNRNANNLLYDLGVL